MFKKFQKLQIFMAFVLVIAFSLPHILVAEFSAGADCTVATGNPELCLTGGVNPCTLNHVTCSGVNLNALDCYEGMGNPACQGDSNCHSGAKHALRNMDCDIVIVDPEGPVIPGF